MKSDSMLVAAAALLGVLSVASLVVIVLTLVPD